LIGSLPGQGAANRKWHTRLPIRFNFPESTFDAIIAWDVFNYYDPDSVRVVAAEVRRVLKPGGVVLAYFDTCRAAEPAAPWRYRIVNEKQVSCDAMPGRLMLRQVYQNRDVEKMFAGLRIVELHFLKNSMREVLMEKKALMQAAPKVKPPRKIPKPRFTIE
jgi:SAM-dependent methyltransferase